MKDYAEDLGLTIVPTFAGPREEVEVSLMPVKICNNRKDWGSIFRVTNAEGEALDDVELRLVPIATGLSGDDPLRNYQGT